MTIEKFSQFIVLYPKRAANKQTREVHARAVSLDYFQRYDERYPFELSPGFYSNADNIDTSQRSLYYSSHQASSIALRVSLSRTADYCVCNNNHTSHLFNETHDESVDRGRRRTHSHRRWLCRRNELLLALGTGEWKQRRDGSRSWAGRKMCVKRCDK